jgi:CRISPR-associated endonuclease Cas3-HD
MRVVSYYSIKDGVERKEYLVEHVHMMMSLLDDFQNSKAYKFGGLLYHNIGLTPADFKFSLLQAVMLHDIGKAFYKQYPLREKHETEVYLSFPGHEVISAVIIWYATERLIIAEQKPNILTFMKPVTFAILYHHHAMDIEKRLQKAIQRLSDISNAADNLREDLRELIDFIPKAFMSKILEVLGEIKREDYWKFMKRIHEKFKGDIERKLWDTFLGSDNKSQIQKKISMLMLSCLISLDYIAASRLRGQSISTTFGKVANEFYEIYCLSEKLKTKKD